MTVALPPWSLLAAALWVLAISAIGLAPQRFHKPLGLPMLALFLPLVAWVAWDTGRWWALALLAGGLSIFRHPLRWAGRRLARRFGLLKDHI